MRDLTAITARGAEILESLDWSDEAQQDHALVCMGEGDTFTRPDGTTLTKRRIGDHWMWVGPVQTLEATITIPIRVAIDPGDLRGDDGA